MENKEVDKELASGMIKVMNDMRTMLLSQKPHIKKYLKWRNIHAEILNSMYTYLDKNYDLNEETQKVSNDIIKEVKGNVKILENEFDFNINEDFNIYSDLIIYPNYPKMRYVVDDYISSNRFKKEEKVELLYSMQKSFVSFFKIIAKNDDGTLEMEDMVTNRHYKIVDIGFSSPICSERIYLYSRLITVDDISFFAWCMCFPKNIGKVNKYIKECKNKKKNNLIKTLETYSLWEEYGVKIEN